MKITTLSIAALITLTGCASGAFSKNRDLESSAPQQGQVISCSGYKSWPDCNNTAIKACPNGFETLAKEEILPTQTRTMRINCK